MRNENYFKGKIVLIVGFGRSGLASANLLDALGAQVYLTDNQDNHSTRLALSKLKSKEIKVELGKHSRDFVKGKDLVIISPGVSNQALPIVWAKEENIPVISEIELAWILCPAEVIAITGTNGKTTVTTLIGKALQKAGKRAFVCGNIGNPFCSEVERMNSGDFVSLEISSFQLENINAFKPKISVILNLSRNHLDRYKDIREYLTAKKHIFKNQDLSDYLVLNYDDPVIRSLAKEAKAKVVYFRKEAGLNPNEQAVLAVTSILGIDRDLALQVFKEFKGVEHRLEEVRKVNGVRFINDSKSTTPEATLWALNNLSEPLVLIAGGREKGNDYSLVLELGRKKIKAAIVIGEAKEKIKQALSAAIEVEEALTLDEAVSKAIRLARSGDCVLFSPMCKSFDMFSNFEERGMAFKALVSNLPGA
ncbi:MAG: UDP-N-acetylmuramoyl-L-alanine--D-glutamate ligase [Candidatus Omnitrophota bacterium]|nr:UDP-N-acetylmuramoyl-L-alanine--D-glutamate ligase [Candidatus Omnitrophota bacterium]